jgi:alpha-1,2-mannosyltransferase
MRTLRSARFRLLLAALLWLAGTVVLGLVLLGQANDPAGQYAFDFQAYHGAAADIAAGRSPYAADMFSGPIPAQGEVLYKYPPLLAQLLIPLAALPLAGAAAIWFVAQAAAILAAVWLSIRAGGATQSVETLAWCAVAATFFLPNFDTLWKGNVSGFLALTVAAVLMGGIGGGAGSVAATLLKTTPVVMLVPALFAGRRVLTGVALGLPVLVLSVLLSPTAWLDFVRVIPNLLSGPSVFANNLAPHSLVATALPALPLAADIARILALGVGVAALVVSVILARRSSGWVAAVTLALAASLLIPSATWYHYLAVLLPLAAFAWARASSRQRVALIAGASGVSLGLVWFPLVVAGAVTMVGASFAAVRPEQSGSVA